MKKTKLLPLILCFLAELTGIAHAASFDCRKAGSPIEKMICSDPVLSDLDEVLARSYAQAIAVQPDSQHFRLMQRQWLKDVRNRANGLDSLKGVYRDRIAWMREVSAKHENAGLVWILTPAGTGDAGFFPRVYSFSDRRIMDKVNNKIDELTLTFGCEDLEDGGDTYYETSGKVTFAGAGIFSIEAHSSYYCNTAYPTNDFNQSLTFDMLTGNTVSFEALFSDYETRKKDILSVVFKAKLDEASRFAKAHPGDDSDRCENLFSLALLMENSFAYNVTDDGLKVQPSFPHVIEACAEAVVVPYKNLRQFVSPGSVIDRIIKAGQSK
jgi:uncharacterized protein